MKKIVLIIFISVSLICSCHTYSIASERDEAYPALFEEICQIVEENFYDASLIQEQFPSIKAEYKEQIATASTPAEFSAMVNAMLGRLNSSHTYYLTPSDYEYYHLAAVFAFLPAIQELFDHQEISYPTVGIMTETIDNQVFIASVLPGGVAEQAGLLSGDEIIAVNGAPYQPIDLFKAHVGKPVEIVIKRSSDGVPQALTLTPKRINPKVEMLEAEQASIRVIETPEHRIGYIHIYSYAGQEYHDELIAAIAWGDLKDVDALIIDLRYGLGGADPTYLNIFNPHVPVISWVDRRGNSGRYDPQWRKPAVFLVNKTTRSGKEILVFGAKQYQLATVIGERTAGAVVGATLFRLSNGNLLYLAVRSSLIDGVNLEGVGVMPDIEIPVDIRYCQGQDKQLERAVEYLLETLRSQETGVKS
ncbi:peptidase S41 [Candidatus Vecturithrix granuli]|uniref:Peptidase S41 n=1 Tax=Vecturithrix granuli TaxID=1499967 RepID=A0A081BTN6_VECG1|nr:peptidase S41 [Candidatus Vecturithrix granuli]